MLIDPTAETEGEPDLARSAAPEVDTLLTPGGF